MVREYTIFKSYKLSASKNYQTEAVDGSLTLTFEGEPGESHLLGQLLGEQVKLEVYLDALTHGLRPVEDLELYVTISKAMVERVKNQADDVITEQNQGLYVAQLLIVENLIELLESEFKK